MSEPAGSPPSAGAPAARGALEGGAEPPPPFPWAALAVGLAIRVTLAASRSLVGTDEALYLTLGENLASGRGFTLLGSPHLLYPPLFPLALGGLMRLGVPAEHAAPALFVLAGAALVPVVHSLARRTVGAAAAPWAAWLVAVSPALTAYVASWFWGSLSEPLFLLLTYGGWLALVRALEPRPPEWSGAPVPWAAVAGGLLAGAYLTRPEGVAFAATGGLSVLALARCPRPRRVLAAAVLGATFLAASAPYVAYLHEHTGRWALSGKSGTMMEMALAMLGPDPRVRNAELDVLAYEALLFAPHDRGGEAEDGAGPELGYAEEHRHAAGTLTFGALFRSDPVGMLTFFAYNAVDLVLTLPSRQVHPLPLLLLSLVGLGAAWRAGGDRRRGALVLVAAVVPVGGFLIYGILPRFLTPPLPALLILTAAGLAPAGAWLLARSGSLAGRLPAAVTRDPARALGAVLVAGLVAFGAAKVAKAKLTTSEPIEYRDVGRWARGALPADAVLVCRKPEIAWYARRPMVPLPVTDPAGLVAFARARGATHVVLDRYASWGTRPALRPLLEGGDPLPGLTEVHRHVVDARSGPRATVVLAVEPAPVGASRAP